MALQPEAETMDREQIQAEIARFPVWHYQFDLQGVTTPIRDPRHTNRHIERTRYFFDPLVQLFGGSLEGKRVLDLGCNAGFWSLKAIEAGADFVLGIDGRQMHVDQSNLVFRAKGIARERYAFRTGNVFTDDYSGDGPFDVVLCLGLMYHVAKPMELFERMAAINTDVLLVDTEVSAAGGASMRLRREATDEPRNAVDYETVFIPSRRAVVELARSFGYQVAPLDISAAAYRGMRGYLRGKRMAFMCAKRTDISALPGRLSDDEPLAELERLTRNLFRAARAGIAISRHQLRAASVRRRRARG